MIATIVVIVVKTLVTPIKAYIFLISDSFLQIVLDMKCNNPPKQRKPPRPRNPLKQGKPPRPRSLPKQRKLPRPRNLPRLQNPLRPRSLHRRGRLPAPRSPPLPPRGSPPPPVHRRLLGNPPVKAHRPRLQRADRVIRLPSFLWADIHSRP